MSREFTGADLQNPSKSTRREFIRSVGKKTIYTVPLIVTFAKADLALAELGSGPPTSTPPPQ